MAQGSGKRFIDRIRNRGGREEGEESSPHVPAQHTPATGDPVTMSSGMSSGMSGETPAGTSVAADPAAVPPAGAVAVEDAAPAEQSLADARKGEASSRVVNAAAYVTPAVRGAAAWAWRLSIIAITGVAMVWALMQLSLVVVPVLVAVLLSSLMTPVVNWLTERGAPRALAAAVTMVVAFGLVAVLLTLAGRALGSGIMDLADQAVQGLSAAARQGAHGPAH